MKTMYNKTRKKRSDDWTLSPKLKPRDKDNYMYIFIALISTSVLLLIPKKPFRLTLSHEVLFSLFLM